MSDSGKIKKTRAKIRTAFLQMYAEKPLEQISIKALTEAAGINRGTFYLHYQDLDELVGAIEQEQIETLAYLTRNADLLSYSPTDMADFAEFLRPVLRYIHSNAGLFAVLFSTHSRSSFKEAIDQLFKGNLNRRFQTVLGAARGKELVKKACVLEYILSANINVVAYWVQSGTPITPEELTDLLVSIAMKGPIQTMGG